MTILLCLVAALLLAGCGGSGGGGAPEIIHLTGVMRPDLLFGYFGIMGEQIRETFAHVNLLFPMAWGEPWWDKEGHRQELNESRIAQIREAAAVGITRVVLGVDYLLFTGGYAYRGAAGIADLRRFVDDLVTLGLWQNVVALYPVDEPDLHGLTDAQMNEVNVALRAFGKPVACCYTDRKQWPGLGTVDWAGFDKYGVDVRGGDCLADLKRRLGASQRIMLFAGGGDPWRDNVRPVLDYATGDPQVVAIIAFIYGDRTPTDKGIRNNGMLPEYAEVGARIKAAFTV